MIHPDVLKRPLSVLTADVSVAIVTRTGNQHGGSHGGELQLTFEDRAKKMAKKTAAEKADKADKAEKGSTSGDKGGGDKTPVENAKENDEQPVELGRPDMFSQLA